MGKKKITCISMQDLVVRLNNGDPPPNKSTIVFKYFQFMEVFLFSET